MLPSGASYLKTLGFSDRFCKICSEVNRYNEIEEREKESDILEGQMEISDYPGIVPEEVAVNE